MCAVFTLSQNPILRRSCFVLNVNDFYRLGHALSMFLPFQLSIPYRPYVAYSHFSFMIAVFDFHERDIAW